MQPCVQRGAQVRVAQRRVRPSALCVATHDHFLDLEVGDGVLDHGRRAHVVRVHAVGNVAVDEDVTGPAAAHGRLGDAAVGASYPQDLGPLALGELDESIRIRLGRPLRELPVAGYEAVDGICAIS